MSDNEMKSAALRGGNAYDMFVNAAAEAALAGLVAPSEADSGMDTNESPVDAVEGQESADPETPEDVDQTEPAEMVVLTTEPEQIDPDAFPVEPMTVAQTEEWVGTNKTRAQQVVDHSTLLTAIRHAKTVLEDD